MSRRVPLVLGILWLCASAPCPAEENQAAAYRDAMALLKPPTGDALTKALGEAASKGWPQDAHDLEALLADNGPALARFDAIPEEGRCHFTEGVWMTFGTDLSHLKQGRLLTRLVLLRSRRDAALKKYADAAKGCVKILWLAQGMANDRVLISRLFETAMSRMACRCLRDLIHAGGLDDAALGSLGETLTKTREKRRSAADAFEVEETMVLEATESLFLGDLSKMPPGEIAPEMEPIVKELMATGMDVRRKWRDELRSLISSHLAALRQAAEPGHLADLPALEKQESEWKAGGETAPERWRAMMMTVETPAVWSLTSMDAELSGLSLMTALQRFHQEKKSFPASLDDLVPNYLMAVPDDPYDGKPFRYAVRGDRCAFWAIGKDLTDDGGKPVPDEQDEVPGMDEAWELP